MLRTLVLIVLVTVLSPMAESYNAADLAKDKEIQRMASLGKTGEALKLAETHSSPWAMYYRALVLSKDRPDMRLRGVTRFDPKLADELARKALPALRDGAAARPDYAVAIGQISLFGVGATLDKEMAVRWFRYAADKGYAPAKRRLGTCYVEGVGVTKDPQRGFRLVKEAAEAGDVFADIVLGAYYRRGTGTAPNSSQALSLFQRAADAGSLDGMIESHWLALDLYVKAYFPHISPALSRDLIDSWWTAAIQSLLPRCAGCPGPGR
jgi:TPR repeat protein